MKPEKIELDISEHDIQEGKVGNPWYCPIALATKRFLKNKDIAEDCGCFGRITTKVSVGGGRIYIGAPIKAFYNLDATGKKFLDDFDDKKNVFPSKFEAKFYRDGCE